MKKDKVSKNLKQGISDFLDTVQVSRVNKHLRVLLLVYLRDLGSGLPMYHDLTFDVEFLFSFLEAMEEEQMNRPPG